MQRVAAIAALCACVLFGLAACGDGSPEAGAPSTSPGEPAAFSGAVRTPALEVGTVALPDVAQEGAPVTPLRAADGGLLALYFGFTSCPDVCPTTLGNLRGALRRLDGNGGSEAVEVAMVTIDPARDTPEKLDAYIGSFLDHYRAYRSDDEAQLRAAEAAFGVTAQRQDTSSESGYYTFDHTATVFVIDPDGSVLLEWPYGTGADAMAGDLQRLIAGERPVPPKEEG